MQWCHDMKYHIEQGSANFLSPGPKNEMILLGRPEKKHGARFNIVLLYLSKNYIQIQTTIIWNQSLNL